MEKLSRHCSEKSHTRRSDLKSSEVWETMNSQKLTDAVQQSDPQLKKKETDHDEYQDDDRVRTSCLVKKGEKKKSLLKHKENVSSLLDEETKSLSTQEENELLVEHMLMRNDKIHDLRCENYELLSHLEHLRLELNKQRIRSVELKTNLTK